MSVVRTNDIDFDPVFVHRLREHLDRIKPKRQGARRRKLAVGTDGVRFAHELGAMPVHITIVPLSDFYVWHYDEPDATNLYLKSSADGYVLISVSGE